MNKYTSLILLVAILSWLGCSCPPDEHKGDLNLEQKAQNFVTYSGSETLTFVNEAGETLEFTAPRGEEITDDKLCYRTTCTEAKFDSPSSCEFYDSESRRYTYFTSDNSAVLDVLIYSDVYDYGMPDFYDALQVGVSLGNLTFSVNHLIEIRIDGTIDLTKINFNDTFSEMPELELNGQMFSDILAFEEASLGLYFKEGKGIIGFKNNEHTWVIQE